MTYKPKYKKKMTNKEIIIDLKKDIIDLEEQVRIMQLVMEIEKNKQSIRTLKDIAIGFVLMYVMVMLMIFIWI